MPRVAFGDLAARRRPRRCVCGDQPQRARRAGRSGTARRRAARGRAAGRPAAKPGCERARRRARRAHFCCDDHRHRVAALGDLDGRRQQVGKRQPAETFAQRHPAGTAPGTVTVSQPRCGGVGLGAVACGGSSRASRPRRRPLAFSPCNAGRPTGCRRHPSPGRCCTARRWSSPPRWRSPHRPRCRRLQHAQPACAASGCEVVTTLRANTGSAGSRGDACSGSPSGAFSHGVKILRMAQFRGRRRPPPARHRAAGGGLRARPGAARVARCLGRRRAVAAAIAGGAAAPRVAASGSAVDKDELLHAVWRGVVVTEDSLVKCIGEIRRALGDDEHRVVSHRAQARLSADGRGGCAPATPSPTSRRAFAIARLPTACRSPGASSGEGPAAGAYRALDDTPRLGLAQRSGAHASACCRSAFASSATTDAAQACRTETRGRGRSTSASATSRRWSMPQDCSGLRCSRRPQARWTGSAMRPGIRTG